VLSRRALLASTAGSAAMLALPAYLRPGSRSPFVATAASAQPGPQPFRGSLPIPRVIDSADIRLPIVEAEIPILPGPKTRMWTYHDDLDDALPLPTGARDVPLILSDRSFTKDNQLTNPFGGFAHAPNAGVVGRSILVNGAVLPHHRVRACRYRLRILNASNF